jgi:NAD(P)H-flavin reductase
MRSDRGKTYVSSGIILPSKVINLVIKRPFHFSYRPGDYVFVNIPAIAKYEWHPFTLSSAPEDSDHIGLHIRAVGQWTNRLLNFFEKEQDKLHSGEVLPYDQQVHDHPNGKDMLKMQNMMLKANMCEHINENMNMHMEKKQR